MIINRENMKHITEGCITHVTGKALCNYCALTIPEGGDIAVLQHHPSGGNLRCSDSHVHAGTARMDTIRGGFGTE